MDRHASSPPITIRPQINRQTVNKMDTPRIKISEFDHGHDDVKRHTVCLVCTSAVAPYTCPRCLVPYCGSTCYKAHGHHCTESFFRDRVEHVLGLEKAERDAGEKNNDEKIEEMLRRVLLKDSSVGFDFDRKEQQQGEDGSNDDTKGSISEERLEELLSLMEKWEGRMDEGILSSLLSEEELQRFHRAIVSGSLSSQLVSSEARAPPWWSTCSSTERVFEVCVCILFFG